MDDSLAVRNPCVTFRVRLFAPLLTLGTIALVEATQRTLGIFPTSPSPLFLLVLACGAFISGLRSGLISAALVLAYLGFFFHGPEGPWLVRPTLMSIGRMGMVTVVAPSIVLIIGLLKRRLLAAERANAASQRREAEELLRLATETAGIGTFSYDPAEGGRINVSDQCRANYGVASGGTLDMATLTGEIIVPTDRERITLAIQDSLDAAGNGIYEAEYRIRRPSDGLERWMAVRGRVIPGADDRRVLAGATLDVTDRKESEKGMLLLKAAVESANDGVVITEARLDPPGPRIEYVNAAFCRMTGYSAAELIGQTPRIFQGPLTDRSVLGRFRSELEERGFFHTEMVNYRKDGQPYSMEWRIAAVRDAAGKVTQWVAIQRDVTERVRAAAERERMLEAERGTRQELERAGRLKDEFLATLSHELRTPLNAILGWTHLLKTNPDDPEMLSTGLEVLERNGKAQVQLIEDLLDVSRIVSGKMRLEVRPVMLVDVAQAALEGTRPTAEARGVRVEAVLDPKAGPISGDPDRLQQVVWNLLSNALKFTPKGGRVQVRLERAGSVVKVVVSDTGQGIAPEFLPHLFERFRQADSSSTRSHTGLGIGLALVRHLVELHGGAIEAASGGAGQGATFTVSLPLLAVVRERGAARPGDAGAAPPQPAGEAAAGVHDAAGANGSAANGASVPAAPARPAGKLGGLRIVAVDDDTDARDLLMAVLSAHGALVRTASSVAGGLAAIRSLPPDLLLCDIEMPHEDGYHMISQVRRLAAAEGGTVPAVALTAYARNDDQRRTLMAGFQRHVAKPVDPLELVTILADLVRRPAGEAPAPPGSPP